VNEHGVATEVVREISLNTAFQMVVYCPPAPLIPAAPAASAPLSSPPCCESDAPPSAVPAPHDGDNPLTADELGLAAARLGDLDTLTRLARASAGDLIWWEGRELLMPGAWDPHAAVDRDRNTLLTWAAGAGHLQVCRFLVEECGMDPLHMAGLRKKKRCALHWAARNGHPHVCEWLVKAKGVPVDICTDNDTTPLHFAIWTSQLPAVRWLVEEGGAEVNRQNAHGCSAAHWAAFSGNVEVLRYLQGAGLDLFLINQNRRSALHKAAVKGHREACLWLLTPLAEGGGGLDDSHMGPEKQGDCPWQLAAGMGDLDLAQLLKNQFDTFIARRHTTTTIADRF
jgi:ankyrin repeat protein